MEQVCCNSCNWADLSNVLQHHTDTLEFDMQGGEQHSDGIFTNISIFDTIYVSSMLLSNIIISSTPKMGVSMDIYRYDEQA